MAITSTTINYRDIVHPLISEPPHDRLKYIVVIPVFAEPSLTPTIASLVESALDFGGVVEVIILINQSVGTDTAHIVLNDTIYQDLAIVNTEVLGIHTVYIQDIPVKIAGVGTARKLAMDEAVLRLQSVGHTDDGVIINLDADCLVSQSYFNSIALFFAREPKMELANIHFEHDLDSCGSDDERLAITLYELHLRYFIAMQRWLGVPYAYQTIGSAFAVRPTAYLSVGGMNRRKAGEDFYFIHKFTKKGTAKDFNGCTIYPASRPSFRVPFGTGKAVAEIQSDPSVYSTYHPESFLALQTLVEALDSIYTDDTIIYLSNLAPCVEDYLLSQGADDVIIKLKKNARSLTTFRKAFYQWFDAFRLMKYMHFCRDRYYANVAIESALEECADLIDLQYTNDLEVLLARMRNRHKEWRESS